MRDSIYRFTLDIHHAAPQVQIAAKRNDSLRQVQITLTERGKPFSLEPGERAVMVIRTPGGTTLMSECEVRSDGTICYDFVRETAAEDGLYECEVQILSEETEAEESVVLFSPRFTILVADNVFSDGAKLAAQEVEEDIDELQTAVKAIQAAQEADEQIEAELREGLASVEAGLADAKDVCLVTAQYNFESDYVITLDKDPDGWVLDGSKRFVLRLTDGNRTLDLMMMAAGKSVYDRWMLAGVRPTGTISGMNYTIQNESAQQPDYVYAPMGIDNTSHSSSNCMYIKAMSGGRYFWISKIHVSASLSGIAQDGQITPSEDDVYAFLPLSSSTVESDYENIHSLPVHTVTYVNTSWFSGGVTGLASGYYYVCTTGKKASGYGVQIALNVTAKRIYTSSWVANAQETGGGHYGDWTPLTDATLALEGAPADALTVGNALYGAGATHEGVTPTPHLNYTGTLTDDLMDLPLNCWKLVHPGTADSPADGTLLAMLGNEFAWRAEIAAESESASNSTWYRISRLKTQAAGGSQFVIERLEGNRRYVGILPSNKTAASDITWYNRSITSDLTATGAAAAATTVGNALYGDKSHSTNTPRPMTWFTGIADVENFRAVPGWTITTLTGEKFKALCCATGYEASFPDESEIADAVTYYLECRIAGNGTTQLFTFYRVDRATVWTGYTTSSQPNKVWWSKNISPSWKDAPEFMYYGDFSDAELYYWTISGSSATLDSNDSHYHSKPIRVKPNTDYYLTGPVTSACLGVYMDNAGRVVDILHGITQSSDGDVTAVSAAYGELEDNQYAPDNGATVGPGEPGSRTTDVDVTTYPGSKYMTFHRFTTPKNAVYLSINVFNGAQTRYRTTLCSKRLFMPRDNGNLVLFKGDPALTKYSKKKLCVIGPSTIMVNLLQRKGAQGATVTTSDYTAGIQEYLRPFFEEVMGFGCSGAGYPPVSAATSKKLPICYRLCGTPDGGFEVPDRGTYYLGEDDIPDLSRYDVFLLFASSNGLSAETASTIGTHTDAAGTNSICGAMKQVIAHIYEQNPKAEIWLETIWNGANDEVKFAENEQIRLIAQDYALGIFDCERECGINPSNFAQYKSSDSHLGNAGYQRAAEYVRKCLIGF